MGTVLVVNEISGSTNAPKPAPIELIPDPRDGRIVYASPRQISDQISSASFNHLDRKLTAAIARQAKRVTSTDAVTAVTAATQAAAALWNQDTIGVTTLRSLKELVQRELFKAKK